MQHEQKWERNFPIVEVEKLSLKDKYLHFKPQSEIQYVMQLVITENIQAGCKNFRRSNIDLSFDADMNLVYEHGKIPATGYSIGFMEEKVAKFYPQKNSHFGTKEQYILFLATLMKFFVDNCNYTPETAWRQVTVDSKSIAHCYDSENTSHHLEVTGSRKVGNWYDLGNIQKIVRDEKSNQYLTIGSCYTARGNILILASSLRAQPQLFISTDDIVGKATPWVVMDV